MIFRVFLDFIWIHVTHVKQLPFLCRRILMKTTSTKVTFLFPPHTSLHRLIIHLHGTIMSSTISILIILQCTEIKLSTPLKARLENTFVLQWNLNIWKWYRMKAFYVMMMKVKREILINFENLQVAWWKRFTSWLQSVGWNLL